MLAYSSGSLGQLNGGVNSLKLPTKQASGCGVSEMGSTQSHCSRQSKTKTEDLKREGRS